MHVNIGQCMGNNSTIGTYYKFSYEIYNVYKYCARSFIHCRGQCPNESIDELSSDELATPGANGRYHANITVAAIRISSVIWTIVWACCKYMLGNYKLI